MSNHENPEQLAESLQFEGLIQGLIDNNYGSCDHFLLPETIIGLNANLQRLNESDSLQVSGIGNKTDFKKDIQIRGDKINWIQEQSTNAFESSYLAKIDHFILYLNQTCFAGIKSYESHYSSYEKESFYKRHIDQFKTEKGRKFSIVLYLNENWKKEDGGLLSLYPSAGAQIDISPIGGRMVMFRSDEMEHEVNPSFTRTRNSIAGWLKN